MSTPALPQTQVTIKDHQYQLTALPASLGSKAVVRLIRLAGPVFAQMLQDQAAVRERNLDKDMETLVPLAEAVGNASFIKEICLRLSEDDLEHFQNLFFSRTEVMAEHGFVPLNSRHGVGGFFVRDYGAFFQLLVEHLKFNFADFFADADQMMKS